MWRVGDGDAVALCGDAMALCGVTVALCGVAVALCGAASVCGGEASCTWMQDGEGLVNRMLGIPLNACNSQLCRPAPA